MDCRQVHFCTDKSQVDLQQVKALLDLAAFWARGRQLEDLQTAIANSHPVVTCWHRGQTVGFARATSDGIYRATIWDVAIHPDYQGLGLGRKLVETVLSHPSIHRVERVYLMTTYQQKFYQRIGFQENPSTTLVLLNSSPLESLPVPGEVSQPEESVPSIVPSDRKPVGLSPN